VPTLAKNRSRLILWIAGILLLSFVSCAAQDDSTEAPLGDVARSLRKKTNPEEVVIDNDNFDKVVESAENRKATGSTTMVFSLDPSGKNFHVSTPDVSCSLSFTAKASALISDPMMLDELPREELAKLQGPATLDGDSLQLSIHNGTNWELKEVVIGLTIVRAADPIDANTNYGQARVVPAVAGNTLRPAANSNEKQPDSTFLLRVKGSAAPSTTAVFRTQLNFALFPDQEWHWAIVRAKGVAPVPPAEPLTTMVQPQPGSGEPLTVTPVSSNGNSLAAKPSDTTSPLVFNPSSAPTAPSAVPQQNLESNH
jgi:hypothetical protein